MNLYAESGNSAGGWKKYRMASLFREVKEPGHSDLPVLSVSIHDGISDRQLEDKERDRKVLHIEDREKYRRVRPGDIAYNMMRAWQGAFGAAKVNGLVSPAYVVARPIMPVNSQYFDYLLRSDLFASLAYSYSTGIADFRLRLYWEKFRQIEVNIPRIEYQTRIANFLDRETVRIDRLIARKLRLVDLIREREEAVFLGAVTGKEFAGEKISSGVEWIGNIPVHWKAPKFTQVARQETGHTPSRKEPSYWVAEECVIPWVSLADIWQVRNGDQVCISDTAEKISQIGMDNSAARMLPENTVILSRTASVGFPAVISKPMATTQDFACWICGKSIRPKYLYYVLRAMKPEFRRLMMGSTHQTIYMPDIRAFRTPLPQLEEQDTIVQQLDASLGAFRKIASSVEASVERLHEFRASLITAAVTGQINVADWGTCGETDRRLDRIEEEMAKPRAAKQPEARA